jgi:hypothetical protein
MTAIATVGTIGAWAVIMGVFFAIYELWVLKKMRKLP